ncbi:predicted protein [Naegleria gruberi]|uniref:Predicted protein n=1 Tax=Naegleria gruberi TaxID=5762 RepID=D2VJY1_NAEGR|nr:uncharacterized protein NAEGRDRAFT_69201 [Naegleria gruberi]EFC42848.1 predicted protein [Naegleria gruberi]|eukprot:XP_002675592.1 predicted protein [Naegleria gruberi strain NEG-M]
MAGNKKRHSEVRKESQKEAPINYDYLEDDYDLSGDLTLPMNEYLSDSDLKRFLLDGYLIIKPSELSVNPQWHSNLFQYVSEIYKEEGNLGNNVLARFPQLNEIFQDKKVRGVLTRVLGREYVMQAHRFMHFTEPGTLTQQWHKDSYFGHGRPLRSNQLRNVMLMYYPQKTVLEMGPTALRKGTQYTCMDPKRYKGDLPNEFEKGWREDCDLYMECEAGSILLIHYDLIHKGSKNDLRDRAMFKFQFSRVVEPQVDPDIVGNINGFTEFDQVDSEKLEEFEKNTQYPIAKHIWNWMHQIPFKQEPIDSKTLTEESLNEKGEQLRMGNHYRFALSGQYNTLLKRMDSEDEQFSLNSAQAMVACRMPSAVQAVASKIMNGKFAHLNGLIGCMYVLSEWGPFVKSSLDDKSLSDLINHICSSKSKYPTVVKIYVAETLGTIFCNYQLQTQNETFNTALDKLMDFMTSANFDEQTRYVSVFSTLRIGNQAERSTRALNRVLKTDQCRYVVGFALDALERIGTRDSMRIVLEYLKASRWCYMTTKSSQF